jgi:hypothetical protein
MDKSYKRVNIMILEEQYEQLSERGLNLSGLIRDLLGDYLSHNTVTLQVSEETRRLYDRIISNTGASDEEIEVHLRAAFAGVLKRKIDEMQDLHEELIAEQLRKYESVDALVARQPTTQVRAAASPTPGAPPAGPSDPNPAARDPAPPRR